MPFNSQLFLNDYPGAITGGTVSATDAAIATLNASSRLAALRQANSRRQQGQSNIYLQNAGSRVIPNLMPLGVGVNTVASTRDTAMFFGAGNVFSGGISSVHAFDMSTKQMSFLGTRLIGTAQPQAGAVSSPSIAYIFADRVLDGFTFSTRAVSSLNASLPVPTQRSDGTPSAVGTGLIGVLNYYSSIQVLTYATLVVAASGTTLTTNKAIHTASLQSPTNGYFIGGYTENTAIAKVVLATRVGTVLAAVLPAAIAFPSGVGNATVGYSVSGSTVSWSVLTNAIQKLTYSTEAVSTVSATLTQAVFVRHGSGNLTSGVMAGGHSPVYSYQNFTDEFTYSSETAARLSATLTSSPFQVASSSTYSPGF